MELEIRDYPDRIVLLDEVLAYLDDEKIDIVAKRLQDIPNTFPISSHEERVQQKFEEFINS